MGVIYLRGRGNVSPIADYVQISPVDRNVAAALLGLSRQSAGNDYWVEKRTLDGVMRSLDKGVSTFRKKEEIFGFISPEFRKQLASSIIYEYDVKKGVRVTPALFGKGQEVGEYFM